MFVLSSAVPFLLQVGRTLPDTVLTRQVAADPGIFQKIGIVGSTILAIAILLLAIGFLVAAWQLRKAYAEMRTLFNKLYEDLNPVIRNAAVVTDDVKDITTMVKGNVRQAQQTVASVNSKIQNAVRDTETQIHRFNTFLGVVQDEAQAAFVSAAATVRGVQTGVDAMLNHTEEELEDVDAPSEQPKPGPRIRVRENARSS